MLNFKERKRIREMIKVEKIVRNLTDMYFSAFTQKKLDTLSLLYSDDVSLDEFGKTMYNGKSSVLKANEKLFNEFPKLWVRPSLTVTNVFSSYTILSIQLEPDSKYEVVDVIYFELNPPHKIFKIRAFAGKGFVK